MTAASAVSAAADSLMGIKAAPEGARLFWARRAGHQGRTLLLRAGPVMFATHGPYMSEDAGHKPLQLYRSIDARDWTPPRPLECMLETLEELPRGAKVVMLAPSEPRPLFRILKANGFDYRCRFVPAGHFEVTVWHTADTLASSASLD